MKPSAPIPGYGKVTVYRGISFKSQCEARWAALFDLLHIEWEYEPFGESTFPDFSYGPSDFIEVKGGISIADAALYIGSDRNWDTFAGHPDVQKYLQARERFGKNVWLGDADGAVARTERGQWALGMIEGSSHLWGRTRVMVTGRGKV